jgi:hypothetical protein
LLSVVGRTFEHTTFTIYSKDLITYPRGFTGWFFELLLGEARWQYLNEELD